MSVNISFSQSFLTEIVRNVDVSNADISFTRNEADNKANIKSYSNVVTAFFGRIISFICHNYDNKQLKASYISDITQRVGRETPGGGNSIKVDFLKTVEGLVNKSFGAPLSARTVQQVEVKFEELKNTFATQAFNKSRETLSKIETEILEKAADAKSAASLRAGHLLDPNPKAPDTSGLNPQHMGELMAFVSGQADSAPRATREAQYWKGVLGSLNERISN